MSVLEYLLGSFVVYIVSTEVLQYSVSLQSMIKLFKTKSTCIAIEPRSAAATGNEKCGEVLYIVVSVFVHVFALS